MTKNWAVSIGINGYKFTSLQPLNYAKRDAILVEEFFRNDLKFDQVWLFSDDSPEIRGETTHPYRTPLLRFFRKQFEHPFMNRDDSLWLFFSGHGIRYDDRDYLLPIDGDPEDPEETAISLNYISERVSRSGAGNIVVILDACRIGGGKGGGFGDSIYEGTITIFSCKPYESSWEIDEPISQGAFTYSLLQNFSQQLSGNYLTVEQTEQDLQQKLPILNQQFGKPSQTPHIKCDVAGKANHFLLPKFLLPNKTNQKSQNYQGKYKQRTNRQSGKNDALALKSKALEAEEGGQFELARKLWLQLLKTFPPEQESAIKAIDRISMRLASQPILLNNQDSVEQSKSSIKPGITTSSIPQKDSFQKLVIPTVPNTQSFDFEVVTLDAGGREIDRFLGEAQCLKEELNGVVLEMVVIPGGTYLMGSSEKRLLPHAVPTRLVQVEPFLLSRYPITKKQWREIAKLAKVDRDLKLRPAIRGSDKHPVVEVTWNEAIELCNRLTQATHCHYRLPTEAEWEYACRAGTETPFHFGKAINSQLVNYDAEEMAPVGSYPFTNAFGLLNMHGNVWEWCQDHWHENYHSAPTTGIAWNDSKENQNRVIRGGSWRNEAGLCRSDARMFDHVDSKSNNIGFRIARTI